MRTSTLLTAPALLLALALPMAASAQSDEEILRRDGGTELPPAQREDDDLDEQVFYSGFGVQQADSGFSNLGEAINLNVVLGFRIPTVKWFGIEFDIAQTIIPGENETDEQSGLGGGGGNSCLIDPSPVDPDGFPNGCTASGSGGNAETVAQDRDEFQMQALGLSAVLKSTGRFYVMGRYGYRYLITSIEELDEERSGTGFGAGAGYRWGKGLSGVELSYQELSEQVDAINISFYARFGRR